MKELEHLSCKERLRELGLGKRRLRGENLCVEILEGKMERGQKQALFSDAKCQDKRQRTQTRRGSSF